jgi:hypothetical protein
MHLLATIRCCGSRELFNFDRLLAESPPIGRLYVRHWTLDGVSGDFNSSEHATDCIVVSRILPLLPNLVCLDVMNFLIAAVKGELSLPSLHTLHLAHFIFPSSTRFSFESYEGLAGLIPEEHNLSPSHGRTC